MNFLLRASRRSQRTPADFFQDADGRTFWRDERGARNNKSLFERMLTAENGMRHTVRIDKPSGHWRKFHANLWRIGLIGGVFFQVIVKVQHEAVVCGAVRNGRAERARNCGPSRSVTGGGKAREPRILCEMLGEHGKILANIPNAGLGGMNICEHAQNSSAMRRASGKGVHVKQIVALMNRQCAAFFLDRAEAGEIEFESVFVRRKKLAHEIYDGAGIILHDAGEALQNFRRAFKSADFIFRRAIRNIFMNGRVGAALGDEKFAVGVREFKWRTRKINYAIRFELLAITSRAVACVRREALRINVILNFDPVWH